MVAPAADIRPTVSFSKPLPGVRRGFYRGPVCPPQWNWKAIYLGRQLSTRQVHFGPDSLGSSDREKRHGGLKRGRGATLSLTSPPRLQESQRAPSCSPLKTDDLFAWTIIDQAGGARGAHDVDGARSDL